MINIGFSNIGKKIKESGEEIQSFFKDKTERIQLKLNGMQSPFSGMVCGFNKEKKEPLQGSSEMVINNSNRFSNASNPFKKMLKGIRSEKTLQNKLLKNEEKSLNSPRESVFMEGPHNPGKTEIEDNYSNSGNGYRCGAGDKTEIAENAGQQIIVALEIMEHPANPSSDQNQYSNKAA